MSLKRGYRSIVHYYYYSDEEEEDPVNRAEDDFWHLVTQEKKDIENREKKRHEAMKPLNQPTPIPEETPDGVQWKETV